MIVASFLKLGTLTPIVHIQKALSFIKKTSKPESQLGSLFFSTNISVGQTFRKVEMLEASSLSTLQTRKAASESRVPVVNLQSISSSASYPDHEPSHPHLLRTYYVHSTAPGIRDAVVQLRN